MLDWEPAAEIPVPRASEEHRVDQDSGLRESRQSGVEVFRSPVVRLDESVRNLERGPLGNADGPVKGSGVLGETGPPSLDVIAGSANPRSQQLRGYGLSG
jgi:hypothetical protein